MAYLGGYPSPVGLLREVRGRYNFAVNGGATGVHNLTHQFALPANAIILGGFVRVVTPPTSGGSATIAVGVEAANDILAAAAVSGAPWSTAGRKSVIPAFTGATTVRATEPRKITATVATAALTAGVFDVVLFYTVLPD